LGETRGGVGKSGVLEYKKGNISEVVSKLPVDRHGEPAVCVTGVISPGGLHRLFIRRDPRDAQHHTIDAESGLRSLQR